MWASQPGMTKLMNKQSPDPTHMALQADVNVIFDHFAKYVSHNYKAEAGILLVLFFYRIRHE